MGAEKQRANSTSTSTSTSTRNVEIKHEAGHMSPNSSLDDPLSVITSPTFQGGFDYNQGRARRDSAYGSISTYNSATSPVGSFSMLGRTAEYTDAHMYTDAPDATQPQTLGAGANMNMGPQDTQLDMYAPVITDDGSLVDSSELANPDRDWPVLCLMPNCKARPFRRSADLKRHYNHAHAPAVRKDNFPCDYVKCSRSHEPFNRRDHFWDHLQTFHREDIQRRKKAIEQDWLESRAIQPAWWRCSRCLIRVFALKHGYKCPDCNISCELKRREYRQRISGSEPSNGTQSSETPKGDEDMPLAKKPPVLSQDSANGPKHATLARKPSQVDEKPPAEVAIKVESSDKPAAASTGTGKARQKAGGRKTGGKKAKAAIKIESLS